jgi:hypothetical protein
MGYATRSGVDTARYSTPDYHLWIKLSFVYAGRFVRAVTHMYKLPLTAVISAKPSLVGSEGSHTSLHHSSQEQEFRTHATSQRRTSSWKNMS